MLQRQSRGSGTPHWLSRPRVPRARISSSHVRHRIHLGFAIEAHADGPPVFHPVKEIEDIRERVRRWLRAWSKDYNSQLSNPGLFAHGIKLIEVSLTGQTPKLTQNSSKECIVANDRFFAGGLIEFIRFICC